jgi:hypothetical protein
VAHTKDTKGIYETTLRVTHFEPGRVDSLDSRETTDLEFLSDNADDEGVCEQVRNLCVGESVDFGGVIVERLS